MLFLIHAKHVGQREQFFVLLIGLSQAVHWIIQVWALPHTVLLSGRTIFGYSGYVCISAICWTIEIQQLALPLVQTQLVTVHQVMSFFGKANFCVYRHAQLHQLGHVIQRDMLNVLYSPAHLFCSLHLSFLAHFQLWRWSQLQQGWVPLWFPLPDLVVTMDAMPSH